MDCPFCAIVRGHVPASLIAETELAVAFVGFRQVVPGHVLIVPRAHVENVYGLDPETAGAVMALAVRVARAVRAAFGPPGLNLWQSNGEAGGQEVAHFHLHVQPRRYDDGLLRIYPTQVPEPEERAILDHLASVIRPHMTA